MTQRLALVALLLTAACGGAPAASRAAVAAPSPEPVVVPTAAPAPTPSVKLPAWSPLPYAKAPIPHFDTPEAMMRFMAASWNRGDLGAVNRVTDPAAREQLWNMHREATNLRLTRCTYDAEARDYECEFRHDYPIGYAGDATQQGYAFFRAAPARRTGWYMTYYEHCG